MVLAKREHIDVLDDDHLVVIFLEQCVGEHLMRVLRVAACQYLHGFCHAHRRLFQSFSLCVFSQKREDMPVMCGEVVETVAEFVFRVHSC